MNSNCYFEDVSLKAINYEIKDFPHEQSSYYDLFASNL